MINYMKNMKTSIQSDNLFEYSLNVMKHRYQHFLKIRKFQVSIFEW